MKIVMFAIIVLTAVSAAFADVPPPDRINNPGLAHKAKVTIQLAKFYAGMPSAARSYQQGGAYDTRDYCSATIDIGADAGTEASVEILSTDHYPDALATFPEPQSLILNGKEKPGPDGLVRRSFLIPLKRNDTIFAVKLLGKSIAGNKSLDVFMTAIPCGAYVPQR